MMKLNTTLFALLVMAAYQLNAQDDKAMPNSPKTDQAQMSDHKMSAEDKAWMDYMTPGRYHQMLAESNGEWNGDNTMWMKPGDPPTKSTSTSTNTMIMGGRYQQSTVRGNFSGMPFEGISVTGYDNAKKVFISTWIDNMGTGIMTVEGPYNEATKTVTMKGKCIDPVTGKEEMVRETWKIIDNNTQLMEMYMTKNGKEFKTMEMKMTRRM